MVSMPGIGEVFVPPRVRLQFALMLSFILLPFLAPSLPAMPQSVSGVTELIVVEVGTGLFLGLIMRLLLGTLEVAGMLLSLQMGLSNASIFNPMLATQSSLPGAMLSLMGLVFIFESGLLEMILRSLIESYHVFQPGKWWMVGDMTEFMSHTISASFNLALRLVAPFMIMGIVFQFVGGIMVKMIPQMQIFFVMGPAADPVRVGDVHAGAWQHHEHLGAGLRRKLPAHLRGMILGRR